ncbi:MAG: glutamate--cysteine ligase [Candidatus Wallbacteria bacterium]|nr:glutamate--cysteine ligase [Candidatus Wallbacteria bacterium]
MSSDSGGQAGAPIERKDLLEYFRKPTQSGRLDGCGRCVGVEYELLPVDPATGRAVLFAPADGPGVEAAFLGLLEDPKYQPAEGPLPPTTLQRGRASINLEPGGQTEVSGSPFRSLGEVEEELRAILAELAESARQRGFVYHSHAMQPVSFSGEIELVPKRRYRIMAEHLARHGGRRYRDMMTRTASVQASYDFTGEADAGRKMRLAMLAAPVAAALFANSPIEAGRESGLMSVRTAIWRETDEARCGLVPAALDGEWSWERYVEHALDVPSILVRAADGGVASAQGRTFRDLLEHGIDGRRAEMADWELHLSTIFTEARIKRVLEVRSSDAPPPGAEMAMPALWAGLFYHPASLEGGLELLSPFRAELPEMFHAAARHGLRGRTPGGTQLAGLARDLVALARAGLARLANPGGQGRPPYSPGLAAVEPGEERYLAPLEEWVARGRSPAEDALETFREGGVQALVEKARVR